MRWWGELKIKKSAKATCPMHIICMFIYYTKEIVGVNGRLVTGNECRPSLYSVEEAPNVINNNIIGCPAALVIFYVSITTFSCGTRKKIIVEVINYYVFHISYFNIIVRNTNTQNPTQTHIIYLCGTPGL